jgi:hypothetical protein
VTINASCNSCFRQYQLKDDLAGRQVRCKECGAVFPVPNVAASGDAAADDGRDAREFDEDPYVDDVDSPPPRSRPRSTGARGKKKKSRRSAASGVSFGAVFGLGAVGCVLFLLTCVLGLFWPAAWAVMLIGMFVVGLVLHLVGGIGVVVTAFREDTKCGLMYLFLPFYALYYGITRFGQIWKLLTVAFTGLLLMAGARVLSPIVRSAAEVADQAGLPELGPTGVFGAREAAQNAASRNNMHSTMLAMHTFHDEYRQFPPRAEDDGEVRVSWQTAMLPYLDSQFIYNHIDRQLAWDDPANLQASGNVVKRYLQPAIAETKEARGYALSHYALNQQMLGEAGGMVIRKMSDGTTTTVAFGEVGGGYKPWADPSNVRDVSAGLAPGPATFGNPSGEGGFMAFADGSVKWMSRDTDPGVLKAIATPAGGEEVSF